MTTLTGRVAVVFGATGSIGRAVCRDLVNADASLVMVGRDADRLDALRRELGATERTLAAVADVTSQLDVDDVRSEALSRFGHVDLLVVSSGIITGSAFEDGIPANWAEMIDVNLRGLLHVSQTFADPLLHAAQRGQPADLVLMGSVTMDGHSPRFAVFTAISAAIKQLARTLRDEYSPRGMRVHIIEPSFAQAHNEPIDGSHGLQPWRAESRVKPESIAAVVTTMAALPRDANLAEVLLLPIEAM